MSNKLGATQPLRRTRSGQLPRNQVGFGNKMKRHPLSVGRSGGSTKGATHEKDRKCRDK